jgi:signal transduction histidine kinase
MAHGEPHTSASAAARKTAIRTTVRRETPALVVFSFVILLSLPLFEGLAADNELTEELENVRSRWFVSALSELSAQLGQDRPSGATPQTELAQLLEAGPLARISRFSPELRTGLMELRVLFDAPSTPRTMLETQRQFTEVRNVLATLESGRDYAYQSLLLFLVALVLAFIILQRLQAARLRSIQQNHENRLRMERLAAEVQRQERHRLARELHDKTGQTLALARILVDQLPNGEHVERLRTTVSRAMEDIRAVSHRLRPAQDWSADAAEMVHELCAQIERDFGLSCQVSLRGDMAVTWDDDVFLHVHRIVGEALINIARHAETDQAWVRMQSENGRRIRITVWDHGRGMGETAEGLGRRGIRERAELIGAQVRWFEPDGGGTGVELVVTKEGRTREADNANTAR